MLERLRFLTSGESHGPGLLAILEGLPAGLPIDAEDINLELARRQKGYGRSERMKIESDKIQIISGVRHGRTIGSPLGLLIENKDAKSWQSEMSIDEASNKSIENLTPRPGHADYAGMVKYQTKEARDIFERASARETAMRVALGAVAKRLLSEVGISLRSHVCRIGRISSDRVFSLESGQRSSSELREMWTTLLENALSSEVSCGDESVGEKMKAEIDVAKEEGDSLGGEIEAIVFDVPVGLGSHAHWDRRLDTKISAAIMSVPGIKSVEIGFGKDSGSQLGSQCHDEFLLDESGAPVRKTNRAGGIEGGMSNGEPILVRASMKPIPTLKKPLSSVDLENKSPKPSYQTRSDVCAVPAAAVVIESMVALVLADAVLLKTGGDSLKEIQETSRRIWNI